MQGCRMVAMAALSGRAEGCEQGTDRAAAGEGARGANAGLAACLPARVRFTAAVVRRLP